MMSILQQLVDHTYESMPEAYNKAGGKFGKIDGAFHYGNYKTRYYRKPCTYSYGEGFIFPLVWGLTALMKVENGQVKWTTDPKVFVAKHLHGIMNSFKAMISGVNFDPAKLGKSAGAYNL